MVAELLDAVSCHQCIEADNCQLNAQNMALKKENLELYSKLRSERSRGDAEFCEKAWRKKSHAASRVLCTTWNWQPSVSVRL